ncbi:MAG TPA: class I SAM-dependent methyltransferase, partial [Thermodesulfobacteriota bacterium]|nr:class I SAM-dependent methyltransferase [Thermodesulfobacteriota bacterium]
PHSTSAGIAAAAGLNERYVREWLGAMVTGGIVEYESGEKTYRLPAEHAVWLTRKAAPNNIAVSTQWFSIAGSVEDRIVGCFKNGGGVPYGEFKRFNEVMSEESSQTVVIPLQDHLLPLVPGIREKLAEGIDVLDVGCGSGYALIHLAKLFPKSRFTGYDLLPEAIERAKERASEHGLTNITFESLDASKFNDRNRFDLITTFDAVHDQADPARVLSNICTALKDDGVYFMQDIKGSSHVEKNMDNPLAPFLYTVSCTHCMTVSLAQGGKGLGAMWGRELASDMLREAGFREIEIKELPHDPINYYYIIRK